METISIPEDILNFRTWKVNSHEVKSCSRDRNTAKILYREMMKGKNRIQGHLGIWLSHRIRERQTSFVIKLLRTYEAGLKKTETQ